MFRILFSMTLACFAFIHISAAEETLQGEPKASNPGSFSERTGANRERAVAERGGTKESEEAVARGLKWLARMQQADGRWKLNDQNLPAKDRGTDTSDVAATAFGLLPMLGAGHTHKPAKGNPYDKVVDKGLKFLMRSQDSKTGFLTVNMYVHALGAMTLCEAYGMTKDPALKKSAQAAINLIVNAQHDAGGWRYSPTKAEGDTSIHAWQISALKAAQIAGLTVPPITLKKAAAYLDSACDAEEGYRYMPKSGGATKTMTAAALHCRQHLQNWGPTNPRHVKAVDKFLKSNPPGQQSDVYYFYYATQVMYNAGGKDWTDWNEKMRDSLIKKQDDDEKSPTFGSWSPQGETWGRAGGRLMVTSLNLLTLEVYYRHTPLFAKAKPKDD